MWCNLEQTIIVSTLEPSPPSWNTSTTKKKTSVTKPKPGPILGWVKKACLFYCFRDRRASAIEIRRRLKVSKVSFYRIYNYFLQTEKTCLTKDERLPGCRRKLSESQIRILLRTLKVLRHQEGNLSVSRLMEVANVNRREVNVRTVRRVLNEQGFKHVQAR